MHHESHVWLVDPCTHMRTWVARLPCKLHVASLHALQPAERSTYLHALIQERQREECTQGGAPTTVSEEKLQRARSHMPMAHSMELGGLCRKTEDSAKSVLTHAKGDGGHDNLQHPAAPLVLHLDALLGRHARVIVASRNLALILRAHAFLSLAMLFVL